MSETEEVLSRDISNEEIDSLLNEWNKIKTELSKLSKKDDKCKKLIHNILDLRKTDQLTSTNFKVNRRKMSRLQINKSDVPGDIWDKYSKNITYPVLYLKSNE